LAPTHNPEETTMNHHPDDPKKPTQIPPGDLSDAVGTHEEGDFNEADGDDDEDDEDGEEN
jgi:anti-sigma factor ChrR (cupin superfamily)